MVEAYEAGIVAPQGLIAHGRGEMFYYLLGERTIKEARVAARAAAAALLSADHPVISVNGNVAALCPGEIVELAEVTGSRVEVGLFHRSDKRVSSIIELLEEHGATDVLGFLPDSRIPGLDGTRGLCSSGGIGSADVVFVALEDGDRARALKDMGRTVIAVDLNPLSRTAGAADITIVDEVTSAVPLVTGCAEELRGDSEGVTLAIERYDRDENLRGVMRVMAANLGVLG